jgi:SAM-dependent methyltransferase
MSEPLKYIPAHLSSVEDLEELRRIYNARLSPDLPLEIRCRDCGQTKQLVPWTNRRVAWWAHYDPAVHEKCLVKLTFRTSFIQDVARLWGHWATSARLLSEGNYAEHWELAFKQHAGKFLRNEFELSKLDRKWLYANLEGPVVDLGCGNAIDYPHFKEKGYMGVDVTPSFLEAAHRQFNVPESCLTLADARKTPFKDRQFRSGYLKDVLLHYRQEDGYAFIDELLRIAEDAYIVWGYLGDRCFLPSDEPVTERWGDGFYYNTYDLDLLEKRYNVTFIDEGTTITRIEAK